MIIKILIILGVIIVLFLWFCFWLLKNEINNTKIGDIFEPNDSYIEKLGPFSEYVNKCARITDIQYSNGGKVWFKYVLYTRGEIGDEEEALDDAYTFFTKYIRID